MGSTHRTSHMESTHGIHTRSSTMGSTHGTLHTGSTRGALHTGSTHRIHTRDPHTGFTHGTPHMGSKHRTPHTGSPQGIHTQSSTVGSTHRAPHTGSPHGNHTRSSPYRIHTWSSTSAFLQPGSLLFSLTNQTRTVCYLHLISVVSIKTVTKSKFARKGFVWLTHPHHSSSWKEGFGLHAHIMVVMKGRVWVTRPHHGLSWEEGFGLHVHITVCHRILEQGLKQKPWRNPYWLAPHGLLDHSKPPAHSELGLLYHSAIEKMPYRLTYRSVLWRRFLFGAPLPR